MGGVRRARIRTVRASLCGGAALAFLFAFGAIAQTVSELPVHVAGHLDLAVSNPPYVSAPEWSDLDPEVRDHEPRRALVSGDSGLEALDLLLDQARHWLAPGGSIVFELAPHQSAIMAATAEEAGYLDVRVRPDLAGRERALSARWPGAR